MAVHHHVLSWLRCGGKCRYYFLTAAAIAILTLMGHLAYPLSITYGYFSVAPYTDPALHTAVADGRHVKTILLWTPFYDAIDYAAGGLGLAPFVNGRCPFVCDMTYDRRKLAMADAVVFHMRNYAWMWPHYRPPGQKYVFFLHESPLNTFRFYTGLTGGFNVTMTYRRDSDVPVPYKLVEAVADATVLPSYGMKYSFAARTHSVAWVVSHCNTPDRREAYVRELEKYIDVHTYGACGDPGCAQGDSGCFTTFIPSNYKFYLAFENSVCKDYVTEKMFRTLETEIIPVVMGGTNYTRDAPPHSVINVLDFGSPRELAEYLKWVGGNETAFLEYFQWKNRYTFRNTLPSGFCHMCELLHNSSWHKTYEDVFKWWSPDMCHDDVIQRISSSTRTVADRTIVLFASMLFMFCFNFRSSPNYYSL